MKAIVLESIGNLVYKEVPDPQISPDEYLVSVEYSGICSSDIYRAYDNGAYSYPLIMGHEFSGKVAAVGNNVSRYGVGDTVAVFPLIPCMNCEFCKRKQYAQCLQYSYLGSRRDGGFAQFVAVKEWNLYPVPSSLPLEMAALLEPVAVAIHAVRKLQLTRGDTVAILGAGLIGISIAIYLSKIIDSNSIFLVDRNDFKLSAVKEFGINRIDSSVNKNWTKELKDGTNGGVNHVIEACGSTTTFVQSIEIVKSFASILWVGNITGDLSIGKKLVSSILRKEIKISGSWNSSFFHDKADDWAFALRFIEEFQAVQAFKSHMVKLVNGTAVFEQLFQSKIRRNKDKSQQNHKLMFAI